MQMHLAPLSYTAVICTGQMKWFCLASANPLHGHLNAGSRVAQRLRATLGLNGRSILSRTAPRWHHVTACSHRVQLSGGASPCQGILSRNILGGGGGAGAPAVSALICWEAVRLRRACGLCKEAGSASCSLPLDTLESEVAGRFSLCGL